MKKVFIDGSAGTTGLRIADRLAKREDISLLILPDAIRKNPAARRDAINSSDVAFFCLPDDAAREAAAMLENPNTTIIDTSTAHRTAEGWMFGFPEVGGRRALIPSSKKIANPGCHASGFISLVAPLVENKIISPDTALSCFSITGYSGGGRKMIAQYEGDELPLYFDAPRMYGLTQKHKHLPEMTKICNLSIDPVFCPIVSPYYAGMEVVVTLTAQDTAAGKTAIEEVYADYYKVGLVHFVPDADEEGFLSADVMEGKDDMQISVFGNDERMVLVSRFDNLGKGASGSAIQNMNLVFGMDEAVGLNV